MMKFMARSRGQAYTDVSQLKVTEYVTSGVAGACIHGKVVHIL